MALGEEARARGVPYVGAPEVLTFHAVEEGSLPTMARAALRWQHLPLVLKRYPRLRHEFPLWGFYRRDHLWLIVGAIGFALTRRSRLAMVLMVPYLAHRFPPKYARNARGRLRGTLEMPGHALLDAAEVAGLAYGSIRHRTLFL